jgi:hypothetical protein
VSAIGTFIRRLIGRSAADETSSDASSRRPRSVRRDIGEYQSLHAYLRDRYADRIVLTFSEIEDLLGFALPEAARADALWWGERRAGEAKTGPADAWTLASRTAVVNMSAKHVVFERGATLGP